MAENTILHSAKVLLEKGVKMPDPASVYIDRSVNPVRIAAGSVIYPGCRIFGETTYIGPSCQIGAGGAVTIRDCQLESSVTLEGGTFVGSVFLEGASCGPGAHIRPGSIMEEHSSAAHCVGLKQTILMPFVTLGSLINFCDCLMAGGMGKDNHSEVGSSFVHFNFTPNQDKATASLVGDVPRGVMLDQAPVFLGGQGGLVGPARIEYGTVIAAGTIWRGDVLEQGRLVFGKPWQKAESGEFKRGYVGNLNRILYNNMWYIGNLCALKAWYETARQMHVRLASRDEFCCRAAVASLEMSIEERCGRLSQLVEILKISSSAGKSDLGLVAECAFAAEQYMAAEESGGKADLREAFLADWENQDHERSYVDTVRGLPREARRIGTSWLSSIVDALLECAPQLLRN